MGASGIVLRVGDSRYAVPMPAVAEVARVPQVTRVPGTPPWVAGAANWRGRILAVVALRALLEPPGAPAPAGPAGRMVVAAHDGVSVGLLADAVEGVADLPETAPPAVAPAEAGPAAALLSGVLVDAAGPLGLLDVAALFALREQLPRPATR